MSRIPESFIQDLLARVDITDVVGRYVTLRKGGANLLGLCPFHNEKSPSFTVSPAKQFYHCFGCGAHGTAITFLTEHTGAPFPEAVRTLASSVGLQVPEEDRSPRQRQQDKQRRQEVSRHEQLLEAAQSSYLKWLKGSPSAVSYLKKRGLTGEVAARFGLGFSGTDRRALATVFPNYNDPLLVESGLVIESDDGRRYDRFRERIIFPIRNTRGKLIGFGGRVLGKGEPKYLNSPETPLFSKGHELYGLWENRAGIRREGFVLVVEGYMDVVGLARHGLENAVATLGTATTEFHIQKLMRASHRIVFSFDGDAAGRRAAWKALVTCLPVVRDDVAMRFLFLPGKHDPDSYVQEFGQEAFRAAVAEAMPLSRFLLDELASRHAMGEAEGRAACVHEAAPLLATLPDTTLSTQIQRDFAEMVRLTPEELAERVAAARRPPQGMPGIPPGQAAQSSHSAGIAGLGPAPAPVPVPPTAPTAPASTHGSQGSGSGQQTDEPPGFMDDIPHGDFDGYEQAPPWPDEAPSPVPVRPSSGRTDVPARGASAGRRPARGGVRAVTPMARRLVRLVLSHPEIVTGLGDQQLEILRQSPHLGLVKELISLVHSSGARHAGALLQAAEPESELQLVLDAISSELLGHDELPDPHAEWNDALRRIELDSIKAEQSTLVQAGLATDAERQRYKELTRRMSLLSAVTKH